MLILYFCLFPLRRKNKTEKYINPSSTSGPFPSPFPNQNFRKYPLSVFLWFNLTFLFLLVVAPVVPVPSISCSKDHRSLLSVSMDFCNVKRVYQSTELISHLHLHPWVNTLSYLLVCCIKVFCIVERQPLSLWVDLYRDTDMTRNSERIIEIVDKCFSEGDKMSPEDLLFSYRGIFYPVTISSPQTLEALKSFEARSDDVILVGYPKSGKCFLDQ